MALLNKTEVGVEEFGRDIVVPDKPKAKLMYYLDSICSVLDLSALRNAHLYKLRKYREHYKLTAEETDSLLELCIILSPDVLNDKVIFQNDQMCGYNDNSFFKINAVSHNLLVSDNIVIAGKRCSVKKIMAYKMSWLQWCWIGPMQHFTQEKRRLLDRQQQQQRQQQRQQQQLQQRQQQNKPSDSWCSVM